MIPRILTSYFASIDNFIHDPHGMLHNAKEGIIAIIIDNAPAFYVISTQRLEKLLELEVLFSHPESDVELDNQFYEEISNSPSPEEAFPIGKFAMFPGWKPDSDFQRKAALWGISLVYPVTSQELAAFVDYWQPENKVYHHVQWQQKLARSIQISRISRDNQFKRDVNTINKPDNQIPPGFKG